MYELISTCPPKVVWLEKMLFCINHWLRSTPGVNLCGLVLCWEEDRIDWLAWCCGQTEAHVSNRSSDIHKTKESDPLPKSRKYSNRCLHFRSHKKLHNEFIPSEVNPPTVLPHKPPPSPGTGTLVGGELSSINKHWLLQHISLGGLSEDTRLVAITEYDTSP